MPTKPTIPERPGDRRSAPPQPGDKPIYSERSSDSPTTIPDVDVGWEPPPTSPTVNRRRDNGPTEASATFAAKGARWRVSFGLNCRVTGRLISWASNQNYVYFAWEFGYGEMAESLGIWINDTHVVIGGVHGQQSTILGGSADIRQYHGTTTQVPDSWLASIIPGYTDANIHSVGGITIGIQYIVGRFHAGSISKEPVAVWNFKGLKVRDPRNGHASAAVETENPSCILSHLITNPIYGQGKPETTALLDSVETNADNNDELVPLVTGEKRNTFNGTLDVVRDTADWINIIAGDYAGCWVVPEGTSVKLVPDRPDASVAKAFTASDVVNVNGQSSLRSRLTPHPPTVVTVWYTDTSTESETGTWGRQYAEDADPGVATGTVPRINQEVTLPFIQNHSEAKRAAIMRRKKAALQREIVQFVTQDEGVRWQIGDRATLTHWRGYSTDAFRVAGTELVGIGRWRITLRTYDANAYTDATETAPTPTDHDFDDPLEPPQVTNLDVDDFVVQGSVSAELVLRISFDEPDYTSYAQSGAFLVQVFGESDSGGSIDSKIWESLVHSGGAGTTNYVTTGRVAGPQEATRRQVLKYIVKVFTLSSIPGVSSAAVSTTYTAKGKKNPPSDVQRVDADIVGRRVELEWLPAFDIDLLGYLVRKSPSGTINQAWGSMTPLLAGGGRPVHVQNVTVDRSPGEADDVVEYAVKAVDSGRRESVNEKRIQVLLTGFEVNPSEKIIVWPRNSAWSERYTENGWEDVLVPGDGWYWITEPPAHDMDQRFGTGSPATNTDKPPHYGHDGWLDPIVTAPTMSTRIEDGAFSGDYEMRESNWQAYTEEWDQNADVLTTGTIMVESIDWQGQPSTQHNTAGRAVVSNHDAISATFTFVRANLPDNNWAAVHRAPVVITGQKTVLEQSDTVSGLASSYPKTVNFDNSTYKRYNSPPLVTLTVETNNASARLTAAPTATAATIDVNPDSGDPIVTVRFVARGS